LVKTGVKTGDADAIKPIAVPHAETEPSQS
jgi:hypothetical protein